MYTYYLRADLWDVVKKYLAHVSNYIDQLNQEQNAPTFSLVQKYIPAFIFSLDKSPQNALTAGLVLWAYLNVSLGLDESPWLKVSMVLGERELLCVRPGYTINVWAKLDRRACVVAKWVPMNSPHPTHYRKSMREFWSDTRNRYTKWLRPWRSDWQIGVVNMKKCAMEATSLQGFYSTLWYW